jgi:hypothetical protein
MAAKGHPATNVVPKSVVATRKYTRSHIHVTVSDPNAVKAAAAAAAKAKPATPAAASAPVYRPQRPKKPKKISHGRTQRPE